MRAFEVRRDRGPHPRSRLAPLALLCVIAALIPRGASGTGTPTLAEYPSGKTPGGVTAGPDGNIWFVETAANAVARVMPSGQVIEFSAGLSANAGLTDITAGPDGNLWFTEFAGRIGRITPNGRITEFSAGIRAFAGPTAITAGPDGNVWFSESIAGAVGRVTPAGVISEFSLGRSGRSAGMPLGLVSSPDGTVWVGETNGRITKVSANGSVAKVAQVVGTPLSITRGPDGNFWVAETSKTGSVVARVTPAGVVSEFPISGSVLQEITAASDGFLYATDRSGRGQILRIATDGSFVAVPLGLVGVPFAITTGPDANVWFTEDRANRVSRITVGPLTMTGDAQQISTDTVTLTGSITSNGQAMTWRFEWGETPAYGAMTRETDAGIGAATQAVSAQLASLKPGTTYHYRIAATNSFGTTYGQDKTFTTTDAASAAPVADAPASTPVFAESARLSVVSGRILVQRRGGHRFTLLKQARIVPVGSAIDSSHGVVRLTNVRERGGSLQSAEFWGGKFVVAQSRANRARTTIRLVGKPTCATRALATTTVQAGLKPKPKPKPHLWARDHHGRFVTHGDTAVATVRGTVWYVAEACRGTLVKVSNGVVSVRDLVRHRTITLRAGQRYLARRR